MVAEPTLTSNYTRNYRQVILKIAIVCIEQSHSETCRTAVGWLDTSKSGNYLHESH